MKGPIWLSIPSHLPPLRCEEQTSFAMVRSGANDEEALEDGFPEGPGGCTH